MAILDPRPVAETLAAAAPVSDCGCHKKKPLDLKWLLYLGLGYIVAKAWE
jgi:hypothetical protein